MGFVVDPPAILVGEASGVLVLDRVEVVVLAGVVEDCGGYRRSSGLHRHCLGTAAAERRRPSGNSSAAVDRAAVGGR